jgi:hypothetical protein
MLSMISYTALLCSFFQGCGFIFFSKYQGCDQKAGLTASFHIYTHRSNRIPEPVVYDGMVRITNRNHSILLPFFDPLTG